MRREYGLESHVAFVDLVKAFDTANHKLMLEILEKYGAPEKFVNTIGRLYDNLQVVIKVGKEKAEIAQTVGVRQGDNLSPVIFLFIMNAFAETLEHEWDVAGLVKATFHHLSTSNVTELTTGQCVSHKAKSASRFSEVLRVIQTLYVDDGAFIFNSRREMEIGLGIVNEVFARFGLEMHMGRNHGTENQTESKTKCMYIPTTSFYRMPEELLPPPEELSPADDDEDDDGNVITAGQSRRVKRRKLTMSTMTRKQRLQLYDNSNKTNVIHLNDGFIDYCDVFKYLGSHISFDLYEDFEIDLRLAAVSSKFGQMKNVWFNPLIELKAKEILYKGCVINKLLWGCEAWALRDVHYRQLNAFHHTHLRRILGIRKTRVIDEHITNEMIRSY